jgi:hypothetical protein
MGEGHGSSYVNVFGFPFFLQFGTEKLISVIKAHVFQINTAYLGLILIPNPCPLFMVRLDHVLMCEAF